MCKRLRRRVFLSYKLGQRRCPLCGCQLVYNTGPSNRATYEHLIPKSNGGTDALKNGLVGCAGCNEARGNTCWVRWINKLNPPKKEYLINKYYEAIEFALGQGYDIHVRKTNGIKTLIRQYSS